MTRRHRAYMLIEMLTVFLAVTVCTSLITLGILAIRRSQDRLAEFANRTALMNDFVQCLRRDVRAATTARLGDGESEAFPRVLELGDAPEHVTYLFHGQRVERVERVGADGRSVAPKVWDPMTATVSVTGLGAEAGGAIVSATVYWRKTKKDDPRPDRRFDVALRCVGELYDEAN